jgi:adenosyl cobinamide kinase/adenosyl cobinamide phosphate guanylyltransferase
MGMTLLTGGASSGKSRTAVRLAAASGRPVTLVATAEARDDEMAARIERHRAERPSSWRVLEEPLNLGRAVDGAGDDVLIVDCLTLWVSNLLGDGRTDDDIVTGARAAADACAERPAATIVITNEVGWGIVPMHPVGRRYRDVLGAVNATFAEAAAQVAVMVAGRAIVAPDALGSVELS